MYLYTTSISYKIFGRKGGEVCGAVCGWARTSAVHFEEVPEVFSKKNEKSLNAITLWG